MDLYNVKLLFGDPERWLADIGKLQELGWQPITDLREGLSRTLSWFTADQDAHP